MGNLDKRPWSGVEPPEGPVERRFLRHIALGESIAPYRVLDLMTGVVPMEDGAVLSGDQAAARGHRGLAAWLRDAESKWNEHSKRNPDDSPRVSLTQSVDHHQKLSVQVARTSLRVVYPASGTRLCACWLENSDVIIEHQAYYTPVHSLDEAAYITAVLNADVVLDRVRDLQPVGQRDPRHFDNLVWALPIPEFEAAEALHGDLAMAALRAAEVAKNVELPSEAHFTTKRGMIRQALADDGVAETIERLVDALLPL